MNLNTVDDHVHFFNGTLDFGEILCSHQVEPDSNSSSYYTDSSSPSMDACVHGISSSKYRELAATPSGYYTLNIYCSLNMYGTRNTSLDSVRAMSSGVEG